MKKILTAILLSPSFCFAQAKLVMNGASVSMQNGAYLVIENSNANAIVVNSTTGGIIQDAASRLRWNIGTTSASYTIPYFFSGDYIPLSFNTSGAAGTGFIDFNSYNVPTWKNSDYLPQGVTNVNRNGVDNSNHLIDRFWGINAQGYSVKPQLGALSFIYRDAEWSAAGNSINESLLKAQRWNSVLNQWNDYAPSGSANTSLNRVILSVSSPDVFEWWTLVDAAYPLPLQLLSFKTLLDGKKVNLEWSTNLEVNTKEFVVQRSSDRVNYYSLDTIIALGNSNAVQNYSTTDPFPLQGTSYYRLKMVDIDGKYSYSPISVVTLSGSSVSIYPNPASDKIYIEAGAEKIYSFVLFDASGRVIRTDAITGTLISIDISKLANGRYLLQLNTAKGTRNFTVLKN